MADQVSQNMAVVFFLEKDISEDQLRSIEEKLAGSSLVLQANFISSQDAVTKFTEKFPELQGIVENLRSNPFPLPSRPPSKKTSFPPISRLNSSPRW